MGLNTPTPNQGFEVVDDNADINSYPSNLATLFDTVDQRMIALSEGPLSALPKGADGVNPVGPTNVGTGRRMFRDTASGTLHLDAIDHWEKYPSVTQGTLGSRPAAGSLGRLYRSTDENTPGGIVYVDTGAGWRPINLPYAPTFSAHASTGTLAANTTVKLTLDVEDFDTDGVWDAAAQVFKPTVAGIYRLTGSLRITDTMTAGGALIISLKKNGADLGALARTRIGVDQSDYMVIGSLLVQATVGDSFEVYGFQGTPGGPTRSYASPETRFQGELVHAT